MTRKLYFFTGGNLKIGYGHVSRSLTLAEKFYKEEFLITFVVKEDFLFTDQVKDKGYEVYQVESFLESHFNKKLDGSIVIIDSVEEDYRDLSYLANYNALVVTITLFFFDLNFRYENLSFFPDFSPTKREIIKNKNNTDLTLYAGWDFFVFRNEFTVIEKKINKKGNKLLITMGGSDPYDLTLKVLKSISNFDDKEIKVILSDICKTFDDVESICNKHNITLFKKVDNIAQLMNESDIIVLNGGLTRYEASATRTPFIAISIHEKQFEISKKVTGATKAINLGVFNRLTSKDVDSSINDLINDYSLRKEISRKMSEIIDFNGLNRIYKIINDEYLKLTNETDHN